MSTVRIMNENGGNAGYSVTKGEWRRRWRGVGGIGSPRQTKDTGKVARPSGAVYDQMHKLSFLDSNGSMNYNFRSKGYEFVPAGTPINQNTTPQFFPPHGEAKEFTPEGRLVQGWELARRKAVRGE